MSHDAIPMTSRWGYTPDPRSPVKHRVECSCGWQSGWHRFQVGAVVAHAEHVREAKARDED